MCLLFVEVQCLLPTSPAKSDAPKVKRKETAALPPPTTLASKFRPVLQPNGYRGCNSDQCLPRGGKGIGNHGSVQGRQLSGGSQAGNYKSHKDGIKMQTRYHHRAETKPRRYVVLSPPDISRQLYGLIVDNSPVTRMQVLDKERYSATNHRISGPKEPFSPVYQGPGTNHPHAKPVPQGLANQAAPTNILSSHLLLRTTIHCTCFSLRAALQPPVVLSSPQ